VFFGSALSNFGLEPFLHALTELAPPPKGRVSDRHALHLAEVIATALKGPLEAGGTYPEKPQVDRRQAELDRSMKQAGLAMAGIAAGVALLWWLKGRDK